MTIKYTKERVWWSNQSEDKPSHTYFSQFISRMKESNEIRLNYDAYGVTSLVSKSNDITYVSIDINSVTHFYMVTGVESIIANGFVLKLELDVFTTHLLRFMNNIKEEQVLSIRSHNQDKSDIQVTDEMLELVPKKYEESYFVKRYLAERTSTQFYSLDGKLRLTYTSQENVLNGCKYYVFRYGDKGNYTFVPVLAKDGTYPQYQKRLEQGTTETYIYTTYLGHGEQLVTAYKYDRDKKTFVKDVNNTFYNLYNTGVIWGGYNFKWTYGVLGEGSDLNNGKLVVYDERDVNEQLYSDISYYTSSSTKINPVTSNFAYGVKRDASIFGKSIASSNYYVEKGGPSFEDFVVNNPWRNLETTYFYLCDVTTETDRWSQGEKLYNNKESLDELKFKIDSSESVSNKFLGEFYLPNILQFTNYWKVSSMGTTDKQFLVLEFDAEGAELTSYKIAENFNSEGINEFNQATISSKILYKYFNIKYYNSNLLPEFRIDDKGDIWLGGYFSFATNGTLVSKLPYTSITNSVIEFPYQLPSGSNDYINYVNGTMNSINTSYQIAKTQYEQQRTQTQFGLLSGLFKGFTNPIGTITSTISGFMNLGFAKQNYQNKLDSMRATFQDAENRLGNTIQKSQSQDLSWSWYMYGQSHYEGVEVTQPTLDTIKQLNNVLYLYGIYNPRYQAFKDLLNANINGMRYLLLDRDYLMNLVPLFAPIDIPKQYYEELISPLIGGVRLWDKIPNYGGN